MEIWRKPTHADPQSPWLRRAVQERRAKKPLTHILNSLVLRQSCDLWLVFSPEEAESLAIAGRLLFSKDPAEEFLRAFLSIFQENRSVPVSIVYLSEDRTAPKSREPKNRLRLAIHLHYQLPADQPVPIHI